MKIVAVMQPYFLPYIGYFQLMAKTDKFVILDDVNFIPRGWVNRNRILLNGVAHTFTIPLRGASQNRLICDIELVNEELWRSKLLRTIQQAYAKAPYASKVVALVEKLIRFPTSKLDEFLLNGLIEIADFLSLDVEIEQSSRVYGNSHLSGEDRILDICRREQADIYINPIGGQGLYDRTKFAQHGIQLKFLHSRPVHYIQGGSAFVPWLSIVDVLMFNPPPVTRRLLAEVDLV